MNYADTGYARVFRDKSVRTKVMPWEYSVVFRALITELDLAGFMEAPADLDGQVRLVAVETMLPLEVVRVGLTEMFKVGTLAQCPGGFWWPNYILAQECDPTDAQRQRRHRSRRKDQREMAARLGVPVEFLIAGTVTRCDEPPGGLVTPRVVPTAIGPSRSLGRKPMTADGEVDAMKPAPTSPWTTLGSGLPTALTGSTTIERPTALSRQSSGRSAFDLEGNEVSPRLLAREIWKRVEAKRKERGFGPKRMPPEFREWCYRRLVEGCSPGDIWEAYLDYWRTLGTEAGRDAAVNHFMGRKVGVPRCEAARARRMSGRAVAGRR